MTDKTDTILRRGWSVFGKLVAGTRKGPSGDRVRQLKKLQKQFGLRFLDLSLLEQALTHRSYSHVTSRTRDASNERMEFLGDSVLGLSVSQFLYLQFPDRPEGGLSKMKSLLVSRKVLSEVSREIGLGEYILLSGEESEMGGRDRDSILADSFEGVIGAIYLDQGYRAASKFIHETLLARITDILKDEGHTNYKSLLQEYVQSRRLSHPVYRVHAEDGPEHEKEFAVEVVVKGEVWGLGRGKNKKDAEQAAARSALDGQKRKHSGPERAERAERADRPERSERPERTDRTPPATATPGRAAAAPRGGKWRTSSASSPPERSERGRASTSDAGNGPPTAGRERSAANAGGEDLRRGIRASRELLRSTRDTGSPEPDRRNEERRTAGRLERDARGEVAGTERRGERERPAVREVTPRETSPRDSARRRGEEHGGEARREFGGRRPRREEPRREDARREAARRDEPRREEPRRDEPRRDDSRREDLRRPVADRPERIGVETRSEAREEGIPLVDVPGLATSAETGESASREGRTPSGGRRRGRRGGRGRGRSRPESGAPMDTETVADGVMSAADGDPIETFPRETNETPEVRHETPPGRGPRRLPRERELPQTFVERETPRAPLEREPHPEPVERESRTMWDRDAAPVPRSPSFRAPEPVRAPELADEVDADVETAGAGLDAGSGGGDAGSEGFTARRRRRAVPGKRR